jgi:hypothetical protein
VIGGRIGLVVGAALGPACGAGVDQLDPQGGSAPPLIAFMGQSNAGDNTDYEQGDAGLGLGSTYASVNITSKYGISDPITWTVNRSRQTLRPSAAGGGANMGATLAAGRLMYQRAGLTEIVQYAVSSTDLTQWLPGSGYPASPGADPDLFDQAVTYIRASETASGTRLAAVVWIQGENDAGDLTLSNNYQTNLTAFAAALRAQFGSTLKFIIVKLNTNAVATYKATVRTAQAAFVSGDGGKSVLVDVDDLPLIDSFHYGPDTIATVGNRCASAALTLLGYAKQAVPSTSPILIGAEPGVFGTGALTPRSRPDAVDGDVEILVTSANYLTAADSLSSAQGFTLLTEQDSTWTTVTSNGQLYKRTVTQATLDANSGRMPSPTVADTNDKNAAKIFLFRGPNATITVGPSAASVNDNADTAISCPSVTTGANNALVFQLATGWAGSSARSIASGPTNGNLTSLATAQHGVFSVSAEGVVFSAFTGIKATAGATGATTGAYDVYVVQTNFSVSLEP